MRITDVSLKRSGGKAILRGDLLFDASFLGRKTVYFEIPEKYENLFDTGGYGFYSAGLLLAMRYGEPIDFEIPLSRKTLLNWDTIQRTFASWFPDQFSVVPLHAEIAASEAPPRRKKRAIFFSSGVDALHTVARVRHDPIYAEPDDEIYLLPVTGMDIKHDDPDSRKLAELLNAHAEKVAEHYGWKVVPVTTNVRWGLLTGRHVGWGSQAHGAALFAVANVLANRNHGFDCVYIASSDSVNHLLPWGSTPHLDHLWASENTGIFHVGADSDRMEKIRELAAYPELLSLIRCCYSTKQTDPPNCGCCEKCLRTMLTLEALGLRHHSLEVFPWNDRQIARHIGKVRVREDNVYVWQAALDAMEGNPAKQEIADAIRETLRRSEKPSLKLWLKKLEKGIKNRFRNRGRKSA